MTKSFFSRLIKLIFVFNILLIPFASCDKTSGGEEPFPPEEEPGDSPEEPSDESETNEYINLTQKESDMANCYVIYEPGYYEFKADNQFNLGEGLPVPPQINPTDAKLIWQTQKDAIGKVEFAEENGEKYIRFRADKTGFNALLACTDSHGTILWSWHIWMPIEEITGVTTDTGYEVMNMNLGALNNTPGNALSYGLLYQWGRKDPFPAAATLTGDTSTIGAPLYDIANNAVRIQNSSWYNTDNNNLAYAIANPTVCLSNYSQYSQTRDWLAYGESDDTLWSTKKTCYDPSPAGWKVADPEVFKNFTTTGNYSWYLPDFNVADVNNDGQIDLDDYNYGWFFNVSSGTSLYFPAAARYDGSYAMLMGSVSGVWGNYWSNSTYPNIQGGALCCLSFQVKDQNGKDMVTVSPSAGSSRADAFSIRCVRE